MTADRTPLPEPGTRVRVRYEGEGVVETDEIDDRWVLLGQHWARIGDPGVTWEPVEPREWADGDVVVCEDEDGALAFRREWDQWSTYHGRRAPSDAKVDRWLADPASGDWTKVRAVVRGGCDV